MPNRLIFGHDAQIAKWVVKRIPGMEIGEAFGPYTAIGVAAEDGYPLAGFIYHRFRGFDVEISGAAQSPKWAQRGVVHALLHYPFEQMGCERVTMLTARRNKRLGKLLRFLGFTQEGTHPKAYDGHWDALSWGMIRDDWRTGKFGIKQPVEMKEAA